MLTGCFRPSNREIVDKFTDLITIFPTENLEEFYDKEPNKDNEYSNGELGIWSISSYIDTKIEQGIKTVGVSLAFYRDTRKSEGDFIINETKNGNETKNKYPIYCDKEGIHFVDENIDESIKEELSNFKMLFSFISLDKEYLNSLKDSSFSYNGNVPMYGAKYKLTSDDINVNKIKKLYPNIPIDNDNISLELNGTGTVWYPSSNQSLKIYLDSSYDNYFSTLIGLQ